MYEQHFGLARRPFSITPDADLIVWTQTHRRARSAIREALAGDAPLVVATGAPGLGKTSLVRDLLHHLPDGLTAGSLFCVGGDRAPLIEWTALAFGLEADGAEAAELEALVDGFIMEEAAAGQTVVLVCDEAQGLTERHLAELRRLIERHGGPRPAFRAALLGHPELNARLAVSALGDLAAASPAARLEPLGEAEAADYILERLALCGARRTVFSKRACAAAARATGGTPRSINILCDRAMRLACEAGADEVDEAEVRAALEATRAHGVAPAWAGPPPERDRGAAAPQGMGGFHGWRTQA